MLPHETPKKQNPKQPTVTKFRADHCTNKKKKKETAKRKPKTFP